MVYFHVLQYEFELVNVWSKSDDEWDDLMKAVGKSCGDSVVWHLCGIPFKYFEGPGTQIQYCGWQNTTEFCTEVLQLTPWEIVLRTAFHEISTHKIACYAVNFFLLHTLIEYKDVVSGVWRDIAVKLMFVSHLALQVYLGPMGEEKLYNISMSTVTGPYEGSWAILRNRMRQNSSITVVNTKWQFKGVKH